MKKLILGTLTLFLLFSQSSTNAQEPAMEPIPQEEKHEGVITKILEEKSLETLPGIKQSYQKTEVNILTDSLKGKEVIAEQGGIIASTEVRKVKVGDKVLIAHLKKIDGTEQFFITDFIRSRPLIILAISFFLAVTIVGGLRGISSILGLVISFLILLTTLYLAHGLSPKTTAAVLGTTISLAITGFLAAFFVNFVKLTGYSSEEATMLSMIPNSNLNLQGILLAGIIIGSLGVLDDITVSQSACVFELARANKNLSLKELYQRGLKVGQDHIASLVNTLVLAYSGASLPLLLLFAFSGGEPINVLLNREMIATEIVRTLIGSLGLVSAVPITTLIAAHFTKFNS